jgi:WD40 repeat protein
MLTRRQILCSALLLTCPVLAQAQQPAAKPADKIDAAHPPVYANSPVIIALAYSPDGSILAVSGYREVLLHRSDGSSIVGRLVGKSKRIESLLFSPDGKTLAAVGGSPAQFGEIQFWDWTNKTLTNAVQIGADTLYGAGFSPDGKLLSCGSADNAVRIVSVPDGKVKIKFDNHSDWTLATVWATDNKHLLSTGRDRAIKLIVAENGSFVDDINTHTSAYRTMARHPKADQVLVAGDDGIPRLYQVFRTAARTMNQEDHNLLRVYEKQPGQINTLAFSADGTLFAAGGETGTVSIYPTDNGGAASSGKPVIGGKTLAMLKAGKGTVHAVTFHPNGKEIAIGGFDGKIRVFEIPSGKLKNEFLPVPLQKR